MNKTTAYVHDNFKEGACQAPLFCSLTEGGEIVPYDGRPYEECAAIGFAYGDGWVWLDMVLLRNRARAGGTFPVRVSSRWVWQPE